MKNIWVLFSVANDYDQPGHNMVAWWSDKPNIPTVAEAMGLTFPNHSDATTLAIVRVWSGPGEARIGNTDYRLEEVKEGEMIS